MQSNSCLRTYFGTSRTVCSQCGRITGCLASIVEHEYICSDCYKLKKTKDVNEFYECVKNKGQ